MPRNLRDFWVTLHVDGYSQMVARGPKRRGDGFSLTIDVVSHGESRPLMRISGSPLRDGRNRVIIELDRPLTPGEEVYNTLTDGTHGKTLVLEEERECHCLRSKDCHGRS